MSDITVRTRLDLRQDDQRWIGPGGISALVDNRTVTLQRSLFDLVTAFPHGFIPSGIVLGKVTATGLWGPYSDAAVDGRTLAVGFLAVGVATPLGSTGNIAAALYWHGEVVESMLPTGHGLDAPAKTDLAAKFAFV